MDQKLQLFRFGNQLLGLCWVGLGPVLEVGILHQELEIHLPDCIHLLLLLGQLALGPT